MHFHRITPLLILLVNPFTYAKTCTIPSLASPSLDDSPGISSAINACGNNATYLFTRNNTYNLLTPLSFLDLQNVKFIFEGNITLSDNVSAVEQVVQNTRLYQGHWITVKGTNVEFTAPAGRGKGEGGWFIAHGDLWWPQANDSSQAGRPHWFSFNVDGLLLDNIKVLKPIAWVFSIGGNNVTMLNTFIDARSDKGFPFNTDGIDLSASNVLIKDIEVHNGDDVINISPPAVNVTVRNIIASGTHGISVSCKSGTGGNYTFDNATVSDSLMAARFKSTLGTTCNVTDITWKNFNIKNTSFPIHFTEIYVDQEKPNDGSGMQVAAYTKGFKWENIKGTVASVIGDGSCISDPCWYKTLGQSPEKGLYLLCEDAAHCKNFRFSGIDLKTAAGNPAAEECTGLEGVTNLGITCTNSTITAS